MLPNLAILLERTRRFFTQSSPQIDKYFVLSDKKINFVDKYPPTRLHIPP